MSRGSRSTGLGLRVADETPHRIFQASMFPQKFYADCVPRTGNVDHSSHASIPAVASCTRSNELPTAAVCTFHQVAQFGPPGASRRGDLPKSGVPFRRSL